MQDPPHSSFPACIAFKAVELQSPGLAETFLRRLREAVMTKRQNIARRDVLLSLAEDLPFRDDAPFDRDRFESDLVGEAAREAFREDLKLARYRSIGRFPALIIRNPRGRSVLTVGCRTYPMLQAALSHVAPELSPLRIAGDAASYRDRWGDITPRELVEIQPR